MPSTSKTSLTIPAVKDALRRSGLLGRALLNNSNYELGPLCGSTDVETLDRARSALNHYFGLVRNANLTEWENGRDGYLCTNVAVQAYIMLLGSLVKYWEVNTASDAREMQVEDMMLDIEEYLKPITDFIESSTSAQMKSAFQVPFGSGGPPEYYYRLCKMIKYKYADFKPEGMEEWRKSSRRIGSKMRIQSSKLSLQKCEQILRCFPFRCLATSSYWNRGSLIII